MSTREQVIELVNLMTEEQLQAFLMLFHSMGNLPSIPEETPDEWDKVMIADSKADNRGDIYKRI